MSEIQIGEEQDEKNDLLAGQFPDAGVVVRLAHADRRKSRLKFQRRCFHHETNGVRLIRLPGVHHQHDGTEPAQNTAYGPKHSFGQINGSNDIISALLLCLIILQ